MLGGGGICEQDASAVFGGGGIAEQDDRAVVGGGGIAEQDDRAVLGGGGTAEQDAGAIAGAGGIAEHVNAVLGGGGISDPERTRLFAPVTRYAPDSMKLWCVATLPATSSPPPSVSMIVGSSGQIAPLGSVIMVRPQGSSDVQTTTRVRSPRNRSRANSSGSPDRA